MKTLREILNEKLVINKHTKITKDSEILDNCIDRTLKDKCSNGTQVFAAFRSFKVISSSGMKNREIEKQYGPSEEYCMTHIKPQIKDMFNNNLYSFNYGDSEYHYNGSATEEFMNTIEEEEIAFKEIYRNKDYVMKKFSSEKYIVFIYGIKEDGRILLSILE